jgi:hypothetical protein
MHSGVVNENTAFPHHLFNVTQAQRIGHGFAVGAVHLPNGKKSNGAFIRRPYEICQITHRSTSGN